MFQISLNLAHYFIKRLLKTSILSLLKLTSKRHYNNFMISLSSLHTPPSVLYVSQFLSKKMIVFREQDDDNDYADPLLRTMTRTTCISFKHWNHSFYGKTFISFQHRNHSLISVVIWHNTLNTTSRYSLFTQKHKQGPQIRWFSHQTTLLIATAISFVLLFSYIF